MPHKVMMFNVLCIVFLSLMVLNHELSAVRGLIQSNCTVNFTRADTNTGIVLDELTSLELNWR